MNQNKNNDQNRSGIGEMKNTDSDKRASQEFKEQKKEQAGNQPRNDQGRFVSKDNK